MSGRRGDIPNLPFAQIVGRDPLDRDPIGKTVVGAFVAAHPDWSDQQIADRINAECGPVTDAAEVAQWRAEVAR